MHLLTTHWSVVTQVKDFDPLIPIQLQCHSPLNMLSGACSSTELNYPIVEKECYAINQAVESLRYLLERPEGFNLYTDHANLVFMLNPLSSSNKVRKNSVDKIHRWASNIFSLHFAIYHIAGEDNVFADLLTRWGGLLARSKILIFNYKLRHCGTYFVPSVACKLGCGTVRSFTSSTPSCTGSAGSVDSSFIC
jgi:hypothetical protein